MSGEKRGPSRLMAEAPATKLSGLRCCAITFRTSDWNLVSGTGELLDFLGEPASGHIALRPELARDRKRIGNCRALHGPQVPERMDTEFAECPEVKLRKLLLAF